ncbi:MAG: hypothetical protein DMG36_08050 [Acidobacteria bacterium]|nr:MAG: hypothetical protein DMG36_08050 [Acidobacteriota bacterium]
MNFDPYRHDLENSDSLATGNWQAGSGNAEPLQMFSVAVLTLRSSQDPSLRLLAAGRLGMTVLSGGGKREWDVAVAYRDRKRAGQNPAPTRDKAAAGQKVTSPRMAAHGGRSNAARQQMTTCL